MVSPVAVRHRFDVRVDYRLVTPTGTTPTTQRKRWFFEVPPGFVGGHRWMELVQRVVYDANVALRRREPSDLGWLRVDQIRISHVDPDAMLAWTGETSLEAGLTHMPWMVSEARIVWEPGACFAVDNEGRYGVLSASAFTQLVAFRQREYRRVSDVELGAFLDKVFPGEGVTRAGPWRTRLDALERVPPPPTGAFRRAPGTLPSVSGPPADADLV